MKQLEELKNSEAICASNHAKKTITIRFYRAGKRKALAKYRTNKLTTSKYYEAQKWRTADWLQFLREKTDMYEQVY